MRRLEGTSLRSTKTTNAIRWLFVRTSKTSTTPLWSGGADRVSIWTTFWILRKFTPKCKTETDKTTRMWATQKTDLKRCINKRQSVFLGTKRKIRGLGSKICWWPNRRAPTTFPKLQGPKTPSALMQISTKIWQYACLATEFVSGKKKWKRGLQSHKLPKRTSRSTNLWTRL